MPAGEWITHDHDDACNEPWWHPEPFGAPHRAYWYDTHPDSHDAIGNVWLAVGAERAAYQIREQHDWGAWVDLSLNLSLEEMKQVVEVATRLRYG